MKKNSFTLVELLAVIAILAIILIISIPKITDSIESSKTKLYNETVNDIENVAQEYLLDHLDLASSGSFVINLSTLCDEKYLDCPVINQKNNNEMTGVVVVNNENGNYAYTYVNDYLILTYDANGGTSNSEYKPLIGNTYGELATPTRTGYTFTGWYTAADGGTLITSSTSLISNENHTIYAHWIVATYRITYNANSGTVSPTYKNILHTDETYGELPTPTRAGYTFAGWYTAVSGGTAVISTTPFTNKTSHTIYAHWNVVTYRITYDANGGTVNPTYKDMSYFDETYGELATPTKTGYTFAGWYTAVDGGTEVTSTTSITNNTGHTIYAHWNAALYTISYDCNGGSGSTQSSSHIIGEASNLSTSGCYKITTGASGVVYYVSAWATSDNQTIINVGDSIDTQFDENTTLYAVWSNLFTLTGNYEVINNYYGNWRVRIYGAAGSTSGTATLVFNAATTIDAFVVGGGASGCDQSCKRASAPGGGGGSTKTLVVTAEKNVQYPITIGNGGTGIGAYCSADNFGYAKGNAGTPTSAFNISAAGGVSPRSATNDTQEFDEPNGIWYAGNGGDAWDYYGGGFNNWNSSAGGHGGGAGSGGVNGYEKYNGTSNTGGGGGAGVYSGSGSGGSGIVVIRNAR